MPNEHQSPLPHDFTARMKHTGDVPAEWYSRGFFHGALFALAGMGLLALWVWSV